jgi:peptidoglycan/xylan/chitin deacetylase (PgdA/CDA1 family)
VRASIEHLGDSVLGSRIASAAVSFSTRRALRVLAYHGVEDARSFEHQMAYLRRHYLPVSCNDAVSALRGELELPTRSVWVTFDDASPTVVEHALPILRSYDVPSTMFVCPAVIDTDTPYWWQTVERSWAAGIRPPGGDCAPFDSATALVSHLKTIPDTKRRAVVSHLAHDYEAAVGYPPTQAQISGAQIDVYLAAGGSLGNHTWDHPCLDTCTDASVAEQVSDAHAAIQRRFGVIPTVFAYPNGNRSAIAERVLEGLGYRAALLFDHELAWLGEPPLRASRLRVGDHNSPDRYRSIVAGSHSALMRLRRGIARAMP